MDFVFVRDAYLNLPLALAVAPDFDADFEIHSQPLIYVVPVTDALVAFEEEPVGRRFAGS